MDTLIEIKTPYSDSIYKAFPPGLTGICDLAWYPGSIGDGKLWAVFVCNGIGATELCLYEVRSQNYYLLESVKDKSGFNSVREPSWSPDGLCLAYTVRINGNDDIYMICSMNDILKDPASFKSRGVQTAVVFTDADENDPTWDPVLGSGYFAYDYFSDEGSGEIRIFDLRNSRSYRFLKGDLKAGFATPSWQPAGKQMAFLQLEDIDSFLVDKERGFGTVGLGMAEIIPLKDSLEIIPIKGGPTSRHTEITKVSVHFADGCDPAWTPDGRHLIIPSYQPSAANPFRVIDPDEWEAGNEKKYWMSRFDDNVFDFPLDISIVGRSITFTYERDDNRYLCLGSLQPRPQYYQQIPSRKVEPDRLAWWREYSGGEKASIFAKIGRFLWRPIAGPDIFINKGIVPTAAFGILLVTAITDSGGKSGTGRDWRPPDFPYKKAIGLRIGF